MKTSKIKERKRGKFMKRMFYVSWNDWNGGVYCRGFETKEEKEKFIERIARTDKKGNKNYTTWED